MMNFKFEFVGSYISIKTLPKTLEKGEIPVFGRSNVGKSSFINTLANVKNLAKTSSSPGKTRTLNFYKINDLFYFVDLPGYGYAKTSLSERKRWSKMIMEYLSARRAIRFYIVIIDIRHKLHDTDVKTLELGNYFNKEVLVILTKKDKLNKTRFEEQMEYFRNVFKNYNLFEMIPFSSVTKEGRIETMAKILERLG